MLPQRSRRWLLVGNSRWHWAEDGARGLRVTHHGGDSAQPVSEPADLIAWAAVGTLPASWSAPASRRVHSTDVPLRDLPPWLGVDRALAGWMAWRSWRQPVLVADAGTVLSLTRVDGQGRFAGGRLIAGLRLQLRAMAAGTACLPEAAVTADGSLLLGDEAWPGRTEAAMAVGVARALAAALAMALRELRAEEPASRLVLTGGDGACLLPLTQALLEEDAVAVTLEPDLALRGLVQLRPGEPDQARPRSEST